MKKLIIIALIALSFSGVTMASNSDGGGSQYFDCSIKSNSDGGGSNKSNSDGGGSNKSNSDGGGSNKSNSDGGGSQWTECENENIFTKFLKSLGV